MRITAGTYRGRKITAPKGNDVRQTGDMVRQAVFNMLLKYDLPQDAVVIDLFCGTGALGLEALSRGAAHCTFIDKNRESLAACRSNIDALDAGNQCTVIQADAGKAGLNNKSNAAHLFFADPPYRKNLVSPALAMLAAGDWLAPGCIGVIEAEKNAVIDMPDIFTLLDRRGYGSDTEVIFVRYDTPSTPP